MTQEHTSKATEIAERLLASHPSLHEGGTSRWDLSPDTLRLLARLVRPGDVTLEVGCGGSTVVLAATASRHVAISPAFEERDRVVEWAVAHGVDVSALNFLKGYSDEVLPGLSDKFDLALVDGAHNFPVPIVDFHFVRRLLSVGGVLIIDDVNIPAMGVVYRFLVTDPRWKLLEVVDGRAAAFRRLEDEPGYDDWWLQAFNAKYPDYSHLSLWPRVRFSVEARVTRSDRVAAMRKRFPVIDRVRSKLRR